jgi:toxin-antitoxin system PIN domain toxin
MRFLPDANILLHALHAGSAMHQACRGWLDETTARRNALLLTDLTEVALLRIATLPRLKLVPRKVVMEFWQALLRYPCVERAHPGPRHAALFVECVEQSDLVGNDLNDAWLAALAEEHRATLVSTDGGFSRFPKLQLLDPTA